MTETVEVAVAGAGVIGLAIARRFARSGHEVVILEAADAIGTETSSRNSEVIHAGLYYPPGSLRARLCVTGKKALYRYCAEHGVSAPRLGKLLVAVSDDDIPGLETIAAQAKRSGVDDLKWLDGIEAQRLEPALRCRRALLSPSTGIVDSHGLMLSLQGDAEAAGAAIAFRSPILRASITDDGIEIEVGGPAPGRLVARHLINCSGLGAQSLASAIGSMPRDRIPRLYLGKGSYFILAGRSPFRRLIYPVPAPQAAGWLGVHVTLDLNGHARFGPDLEYVDRIDYAVDAARAAPFYAAVRRYWPDLSDGALLPGYAGIRPKLSRPGEPTVDFVIQGPADHGVPGLINLFGIDSPGLTSCLAIADHVGRMAGLPADPLFSDVP